MSFTAPVEYAFRHPLIRTVAYESQLKADRAQLHRRLAAAIEARGVADENAALIAQHVEAAGDLHGVRLAHARRDVVHLPQFRRCALELARAREVADRLPDDDPDRLSMCIAPRTLLCANEYRIRSGRADIEFASSRSCAPSRGTNAPSRSAWPDWRWPPSSISAPRI